jgi:hypothetical protein
LQAVFSSCGSCCAKPATRSRMSEKTIKTDYRSMPATEAVKKILRTGEEKLTQKAGRPRLELFSPAQRRLDRVLV